MMRILIMLEQTEEGFAVQVPDLAITTFGDNIETAKQAAGEAIEANLDAYRETGQRIPTPEPIVRHLENPEFRDLLFTYIDISWPKETMVA